jgi:N-acetyl-alpha-D-glucosaminyl L-malate synthase BshA
MKIGIVCYPTFGGSGVVATELGIALAKKGHQVHFISYDQPVRLGNIRENIFYHEVVVSDYPLFDYTPYELVLTSKLVDVVKYEKLDLLHVHYAIPHASAAYMAKQILKQQGIKIPYITTLHGTDITLVGKDPSFEPVITFSMNQSDAVTAVSESLKQDTYKFFNLNNEITVIPNFIRMKDYDNKADEDFKSYCSPNGEKILIHISNFRKVKRVEDVVKIFALVKQEVNCRLLLIGDGPERNNIEKLCREMNICKDVLMIGKLKQTTEVLAVSDVFLLPSETESFGLAALEAMASGVPVISSNTGGIPEVNKHGVSGYLSDVGNIQQMANYAIKLLTDNNLYNELSLGAKKTAMNFDLEKILPEYENLYNKVVNNPVNT